MAAYKKDILSYLELYIVKFTKCIEKPYLLFIHGGPGFNCGIVEHLIEHNKLFDLLDYNIILYDQRSCGRSRKLSESVSHEDNVNDLQALCHYLIDTVGLEVKGLIGHSYGAKILFDFYKKFDSNLPGIFVATANSILTPRINNLMIDLSYLKKSNPYLYNEILQEMNNMDFKTIWTISEKLAPLFQENKDRPYLYWANLDYFEVISDIQKQINLPINTETFMSVRKDLYSSESNFSVDINNLKIPYLWINGFHDFIMNGSEGILSSTKNITILYKSSHYPHIEENNRFSNLVNEFIENIRS